MENNPQNGFPHLGDATVRIFAIVGFVAVLGIGMWGSVKIASNIPNAFSSIAAAFVSLTSIFVPANQTLPLSAPATVAAGQPFTLSWTSANQDGGSYVFRYDCTNGIYFTSPSPSGGTANVYCNVPFNFLNSNNSITLTPVMTDANATSVPVTIYIDYIPNGKTTATISGKATITVTASSATPATTPATPAPTTPVTPSTPTPGTSTTHMYLLNNSTGVAQPSNPNGYVDLKATILEVGVVDKSSGAFFASSTPSLGEIANSGQYRLAVRFAVENDGTKTSPQFDFNVVLPTMPMHIFTSQAQQALAPGDSIQFTIGFDLFNPDGNGIFTVNVDPSDRINEPNKDNNIVHYTITTTP
ncbi:MAG: hypothetical protein KGI73_03830 [Patescibacteria group bacterium]|nr:hypothetical protein [Patescibacteria group bacterium]